MSLTSSRDNWERLVAAVLKREEIWQLCHQQSRSPSVSTISSDTASNLSELIPNFSSNRLVSLSVSPSPIPQRNPSLSQEHLRIHLGQLRRFSLDELQVATGNFSDKNVFEHGYNTVYKGELADGSPVVVKRHRDRGDRSAERQFIEEVEIDSIASHPNVLHLLGFCSTPKEKLLVYPFMVNGSVASCLRGKHESHAPLDWTIRRRIAWATARGLAYLHDKCVKKIIHCDVKAANVLLDEDFKAVIGDFELATIMDHNVTHVDVEEVKGTLGHIAPEHLSSMRCSEKIDIFGFGMFLLELITGRRAYDLDRLAKDEGISLRNWVKRNYEDKKWEMMVDAYAGLYMEEMVELLVQVALLCTHSNPQRRPAMSEVFTMLKVGDVLDERWRKQCLIDELDEVNDQCRIEEFKEVNDQCRMEELEEVNDPCIVTDSAWIIVDSISSLQAVELSGPR